MRLETAVHQSEAIALYTRAGYQPIPNYPPYEHKTLSRCYAKRLPLPRPARPEWDGGELATFLAGQGLPSKDVLAPGSRYWLTRDTAGPATALGWERQDDRVLLRSVAVRPDLRGCGAARRLVEHALTDAAAQGARTAYLFSTEAGPFWTRLGFRPVPVAEVAHALPNAPPGPPVPHRRNTCRQGGLATRPPRARRPSPGPPHHSGRRVMSGRSHSWTAARWVSAARLRPPGRPTPPP